MRRITLTILTLSLASIIGVYSYYRVLKREPVCPKGIHEGFNWKIDGYLDDVSPDGEWVLYRTPDTWEPDDWVPGSLRVFHPKSTRVVVIDDKITINDVKSTFLSGSLVAVPAKGKVAIYDIKREGFIDTLFSFDCECGLLEFSLSEDKIKAATLLHDFKAHQVILKVVDLANDKGYEVGYHPFEPEGCPDFYPKAILWHDDQLVYSLGSDLYYYKLGDVSEVLLASHVHAYALDRDRLIFIEGSNILQARHTKQFSFSELNVTEAKLNGGPQASSFGKIWLETVRLDNIGRTLLSFIKGEEKKQFLINDDGRLEEQTRTLLHKTQKLCIEQLVTRVPTPNGLGYKSELLVSGK